MSFLSILYKSGRIPNNIVEPKFISDLNLDQIINCIVQSQEKYNLKPFFYDTLHDITYITYRQEIMKDLENLNLLSALKEFTLNLFEIRNAFSKPHEYVYKYQRERTFLNLVGSYCKLIHSFTEELSGIKLKSEGMKLFFDYLLDYQKSNQYKNLLHRSETILGALSEIKYSLRIKGLDVEVMPSTDKDDYGKDVVHFFSRLIYNPLKESHFLPSKGKSMNQIDECILERVAKLYPTAFENVETFYSDNQNFIPQTILRFEQEIQFYISYLDYISSIKLPVCFCYPILSNDREDIYANNCFDLSLAYKLSKEGGNLICNDFKLSGSERIMVVTGPNQGGKTTFARSFAQLHYLSSLGLTVPGNKAKLYLFDNIYTLFEREENTADHRSKLEDDISHIYQILQSATPHSIIVFNEIFTSTTAKDATYLSKEMMSKLLQLDLFCVWVTFIDELSIISDKVVSMVSEVDKQNINNRTFKILRKPADGLAYALSIAKKHNVSYQQIINRI